MWTFWKEAGESEFKTLNVSVEQKKISFKVIFMKFQFYFSPPEIQEFPNFKFSQIRFKGGGGVLKFPIFPKLKKVKNILGEGVKKILDVFHLLGHILIWRLP